MPSYTLNSYSNSSISKRIRSISVKWTAWLLTSVSVRWCCLLGVVVSCKAAPTYYLFDTLLFYFAPMFYKCLHTNSIHCQ